MVSKSVTFLLIGVLIGGVSGYGVSYVYSPQTLLESGDPDILSRLGSLEESLSQLGSVFNRLSNLETTAASIPNIADQLSGLQEQFIGSSGTSDKIDLDAVNDDITRLSDQLDTLQSTVSTFSGIDTQVNLVESKLEDLEDETAKILGIENQISSLSSSTSALSASIQNLQNTDSQHNTDLSNLVNQLTDLQNELDSIANNINDMTTAIESEQAYSILKLEMMNPGSALANTITDEIFEDLRYSESMIVQWIAIVGSTTVKGILGSALDSMMGSLVWNDHSAVSLGNHYYTTYIVSYFPIVLDTGLPLIGEITVAQVGLVIQADVNVDTLTVSSYDVYDVFI